jgi:hypothetical protein
MSRKRDRLTVGIFGLLSAVAEGPITIAALVFIVVLLTRTSLWWW